MLAAFGARLTNLFKGRIGRKIWILCSLLSLALGLVVGFSIGFVAFFFFLWPLFFLFIPVWVVYIILIFSLHIRRFHDLGYSGWFALALFVPFVNFALFLVLLFARGMQGDNKYGPEPQDPKLLDVLFGRVDVAHAPAQHHERSRLVPLLVFIGTPILIGVGALIYFIPTLEIPDRYKQTAASSLLHQMESAILPVGYFAGPEAVDFDTVTQQEWASYFVYTEPAVRDDVELSPVQKEIYSAVVKIVCEDEDYYYYGSGTNTSSAGYVLTNLHVIEGKTDLDCLVGFPDPVTGVIREVYWAVPIIDAANETGHDLAMLSVEEPVVGEGGNIYGFYDKFLEGTFAAYTETPECLETQPRLGSRIIALGYPALSGGALTITDGLVSSLYSADGYLITSAKISDGNSGGLAVDEDGCFIGVPTGVYLEEENEQYGEIIDAEFVYEFFDAIMDDMHAYSQSRTAEPIYD